MTIKRYGYFEHEECAPGIVELPDGDYVRYEDYEVEAAAMAEKAERMWGAGLLLAEQTFELEAEIARLHEVLAKRLCDEQVNSVLGIHQVRSGRPLNAAHECGKCAPCLARKAMKGDSDA